MRIRGQRLEADGREEFEVDVGNGKFAWLPMAEVQQNDQFEYFAAVVERFRTRHNVRFDEHGCVLNDENTAPEEVDVSPTKSEGQKWEGRSEVESEVLEYVFEEDVDDHAVPSDDSMDGFIAPSCTPSFHSELCDEIDDLESHSDIVVHRKRRRVIIDDESDGDASNEDERQSLSLCPSTSKSSKSNNTLVVHRQCLFEEVVRAGKRLHVFRPAEVYFEQGTKMRPIQLDSDSD